MDSLTEQIIADIIAEEMGIDNTRNIWVRSQNRKIPNDNELYVVVGMTSAGFIGSKTSISESGGDVIETNDVQLREDIQVDILSSDNQALMRRWEVIAAIRSIYAQQKMEENSFKIFRQPLSFINVSSAEGGSNLNRFTLSIPCFVWYQKQKVLSSDGGDYYDSFTTRVDDENTIGETDGLIEFAIDETTVI